MPETETPAPESKAPRKRRVTRAGLRKEIERQMLEATPDVLQKQWLAIKAAQDKGEKWAVELVARLFYGDKGPGAVSITSQTLINNAAPEREPKPRGFEEIIRRLETKDQMVAGLLPEPTPIREARLNSDDVLDAELV